MEFIFPELNSFNSLCFVDSKNLLVSKSNRIYIFDLENKSFSFLVNLPCRRSTKCVLKFSILSRLYRAEIIYGIHFYNNNFLVCFENFIYNVDISTKEVKKVYESLNGRRPLSINVVKSVNSFSDGAYFGEYFSNITRKEVNVFRINFDFSIQVIHVFSKGIIEHVHSLIYDKYRDCFWILTGDFDEAAAIWQAKSNFAIVNKIVGGKQVFRSCVAFPIADGLLYATDSQYQRNSINLLIFTNGIWNTKFIFEVNGPVIYGAQYKDKYLFSTAVEGLSFEKPFFHKYLDRKSGPGVIEDFSHLVFGNYDEGFKTIYKCKKDFLPFILFQFGVITFPTGQNLTNTIFCSPRALNIKSKSISFKY